MIRITACLILCLSIACGIKAPCLAEPSLGEGVFQAPAHGLRSFEVMRQIPSVSAAMRQFVEDNEGLPGSVAAARIDRAGAMKGLRDLFEGKEGRDLLAEISRGMDQGRIKSPEMSAAALLGKKQPEAALACMLVQVERQPENKVARLNLAALALSAGRANEALGLVGDMDPATVPGGGMGIAGRSLLDYLRAYAHLLRGEYREAEALLLRVVEAEPDLREAALCLALVEEKLGKDVRRPFLLGCYRGRPQLLCGSSAPGKAAAGDPFNEGEAVAPAPEAVMDLSRGMPGRLALLQLPASPGEAFEWVQALSWSATSGLERQFREEAVKAESELGALYAREARRGERDTRYLMRQRRIADVANTAIVSVAPVAEAWRRTQELQREFADLCLRVHERTRERQSPVLKRKDEATYAPEDVKAAVMRQCQKELDAITQSALDEMGSAAQRYLDAEKAYYRLHSAVCNGLLSHVGVPAMREQLILQERILRLNTQARMAAACAQVAGASHPYSLPRVPESKDGEGPFAGPCTEERAKHTIAVDLEVFSVEVSCKSLSVELESQIVPTVLGLSLEVGVEVGGKVSMYAGPKLGGKVPGYTAKEGMYVEFEDGQVKDAGVKVELKATTGVGPVTYNRQVDNWTISFVPSPDRPGA